MEQLRGKHGTQIEYDLGQDQLLEICQQAVLDVGLKIQAVHHKTDRIELLAYNPPSEYDYGSNYGIYLYSLSPTTTQLRLFRRLRTPSRTFVEDVTEELLAKIDTYVLDAMGL